jgi:predicted ATPase/DNA-binding SARP family transcriptional activator
VTTNGEEVAVSAPKERALLMLLALAGEHPVLLHEILTALWGEDPPTSARKAVQTYVSSLRRRLPPGSIETVAGGGYRLSATVGPVDTVIFEQLVREGQAAAAGGDHLRAVKCLSEARTLWRGEPLFELTEHPAGVALQTRLCELATGCEEELAQSRLELGEHAVIVTELEAAVAAEPLRERRWTQLMLALYRSGRQADALRAYQRLRKVLGEELGIEPGPEVAALEADIFRQRPELAWSGVGLEVVPEPEEATSEVGPERLPRLSTPLIGRDAELALALQLIANRRLVTLVGAGGAGKTTLAMAIASRCAARLPEGVYWVSLQSLTTSRLVVPALAEAVGARGEVARHIGDREILVILDNFEQVIDAAPEIAGLLAGTERVRILVTSREPLRVAGEQLVPVGPLAEPDAADLFVERASAEAPAFDADPSAIAAICRRLDGLPLAIELAAARITLFDTAELLARLNRALPILAGRRRDVPDRHRTLEGAIRWSYDLLESNQQHALRWLSPLESFDLSTAVEVAETSLDTLHSLVDKSLIRRVGNGRFQLLQTVREFGLDRLDESGESDAAHRALLRFALHSLDQALERLHGPEQPVVLANLDSEHGNLRAAAQWAITNDRLAATQLAVRLGWYWLLRDHTGEGVSFLEALAAPTDGVPIGLHALLLSHYGRLLFYRGEALRADGDAAARDVLVDAEAAWQRTIAERPLIPLERREHIACLTFLGIAAGSSGDRGLARRSGLEAIAIADATGDDWCVGIAYWGLGTNVFLDRCEAEKPDEARALLETSVDRLRPTGDFWALGAPLLYLARQLLISGDSEQARIIGTAALHAFQRAGGKWRTALALRHLAQVAQAEDNRPEAEAKQEEADRLERELGRLASSPASRRDQ